MAAGKWVARFCDQWSQMAICRYLKLSGSFSKWLGRSGVTFSMYLMPYFLRTALSAELAALPRKRFGMISYGSELLTELILSNDNRQGVDGADADDGTGRQYGCGKGIGWLTAASTSGLEKNPDDESLLLERCSSRDSFSRLNVGPPEARAERSSNSESGGREDWLCTPFRRLLLPSVTHKDGYWLRNTSSPPINILNILFLDVFLCRCEKSGKGH